MWAQLGSRQQWWPAIVIDGEDCGHATVKEAHSWVFWFGDHKVSQVFAGYFFVSFSCNSFFFFVYIFFVNFWLCLCIRRILVAH